MTMAVQSELTNLNDCVRAFESSRRRSSRVRMTEYLPVEENGERLRILAELVRVDMEYSWNDQCPRRLENYLQEFPELGSDLDLLGEIAFEEYRLRCDHGEQPRAAEYRQQYGVASEAWASTPAYELPATNVMPPLEDLSASVASAAARHMHGGTETDDEGSRYFRSLRAADLSEADRLAEAIVAFPAVATEFYGFHLVSELGRGAFARVYLALQGELAKRPVALKVSAEFQRESQTLAQLQHQNIMPIFSVHGAGALHAVCMPYYGSTTLADVIGGLRGQASLPASGQHFISTLNNRKASTRTASRAEASAGEIPAVPASTQILDRFHKSSYIESVLWLTARVADGLAHAHSRGVIHRDLKPANILLTDDGQPMVLDFNLADNSHAGPAGARVGGTLPYMAPEHLAAFQGFPGATIDARSDLYALGLILFEMLAGRSPFPTPTGSVKVILPLMIRQRQAGPPPLRSINSAISPAVEAIVHKCLAPAPADRYSSAEALQEDLDRHLNHRPLKFAPNPSWRERASKWSHRHPRLSSTACLGGSAAAVVLSLGLAYAARGDQIARYQAAAQFDTFKAGRNHLEATLGMGLVDANLLPQALNQSRQMLAPYAALEDPQWSERPSVAKLPAAEQQELRQHVGEVLYLTARGTALQPGRQEEAERIAKLAVGAFASTQVPAPVQRLADRLAGQPMAPTDAATPREAALTATELIAQGKFREALPFAMQAVDGDPTRFAAWFALGQAHAGVGNDEEAQAAFTTSIALAPDQYWAHFNRGLVCLRQKKLTVAIAAFGQAIALDDTIAEGYVNRALARRELNDGRGALDDLSKALARGASQTRLYFLRARVHKAMKNSAAEATDLATGMALTPTDELSWVARGIARMKKEPQAAIDDFNEALKLNPRSRSALQSKASVLAESLGKLAESIAVLDRVVELYPDYLDARGGRGVLHARLGDRHRAVTDAEDCLQRDHKPKTLYQVAGIYAITSKSQPDDRDEALRLLRAALHGGVGLDFQATDKDLDPIRQDPEFRQLINAAGKLKEQ